MGSIFYIYFYALYCIFELETNSAKSIFEFNKLVLMEKTWRWFGKKDPITLDMLRQIGVEGIVTSLYEVQPGEVWDTQTIHDLKDFIESSGLRWSVVESLPVSESIKYGGIDRDENIENYKTSLANLGKEGVIILCLQSTGCELILIKNFPMEHLLSFLIRYILHILTVKY